MKRYLKFLCINIIYYISSTCMLYILHFSKVTAFEIEKKKKKKVPETVALQ